MQKKAWRTSVMLPASIEERVYKMRQSDEFARCSISEVLRIVMEKGLEAYGYPDKGNTESRPA